MRITTLLLLILLVFLGYSIMYLGFVFVFSKLSEGFMPQQYGGS